MFRAAKQGRTRRKQRVARDHLAQRRTEDFRRGVGIASIQAQVTHEAAMQFQLGAVRERLVDVYVLADGAKEIELDLMAEKVIEICRLERQAIAEERLLKTALERAVLFRP